MYYHKNRRLELDDEYCDVPEWSNAQKDVFVKSIEELFDRDGTIFSAFDEQRLVGMATLDTRFLGVHKDLLNLSGLWVTKDYRKQSVATKLIEMIKEKAREDGAKGLYVSSTESKNTVEFYMRRGFVLTKFVDQALFAKEPKDIHMEMYF